MAAAFNMEGAFNDGSFSLLSNHGMPSRGIGFQPVNSADNRDSLKAYPTPSVREILFQIDQLTEPYGGRSAYTRDDQTSHRRVADEMHQLRGMALVSPSIFLAVAAFLFNIMLSRMVHQQQEQIATLRAFGYRR
jgi:putative ABC transport system permease protein